MIAGLLSDKLEAWHALEPHLANCAFVYARWLLAACNSQRNADSAGRRFQGASNSRFGHCARLFSTCSCPTTERTICLYHKFKLVLHSCLRKMFSLRWTCHNGFCSCSREADLVDERHLREGSSLNPCIIIFYFLYGLYIFSARYSCLADRLNQPLKGLSAGSFHCRIYLISAGTRRLADGL